MGMDYPSAGLAQGDLVDIPAQALHQRHGLRLRLTEVYVVMACPLIAVTGRDLATGRPCTVWVDPAWVQVVLPDPPGHQHVPRAS
jgi:hypothetical protein